jgi:hypothetical protein
MLNRAGADAWQVIAAAGLCLLVPALAAAALWPAGLAWVGLRLLKGFGLFWLVVFVVYASASRVQRRLRVDLYSHANAFVASNLIVGGVLTFGWTAFAAQSARGASAGAGAWAVGLLYLFGLLSCVAACQVVGSFYNGHVYKFACLTVACAGFALCAALGWMF